MPRESAGLAVIPKEKRPLLRRLGVTIGALDVFVPALLKPGPRALLKEIGADARPVHAAMDAVIAGEKGLPAGYRRAGSQAIRVDMAEKLFRAAHDGRAAAGGRTVSPRSGARHFDGPRAGEFRAPDARRGVPPG